MRSLLFTAITIGTVLAPYAAYASKIIGNG